LALLYVGILCAAGPMLWVIDTHVFLSGVFPVPPWCTLFPYTTLFRSHSVRLCLGREWEQRAGKEEKREASAICVKFHADCRCFTDRKSTRLNSSHVSSSYAVFCLKKKSDGEREERQHSTTLRKTGAKK